LQTNTTKAKLKAGETVLGVFVRYPDASFVEVVGYQGWDFCVFDAEHGTIEPRDCENMVRAAELRGMTPLVRVTTNFAPVILRYLDSGAQGLHVPWINTAAEAERAVGSVKYYPMGIRGLAGVRAAEYGQRGTFGEYVEKANAETLVSIHIETIEAVNNLPEIVKVPGIDIIFIGPTDLSHSLGVPGQVQHPSVVEAIDRIVQVTKNSDATLGVMVGNAAAAQNWRKRGARYIAITSEGVFAPAMREYLRAARE
jgi:4-hydroxy-2-oxoheptanedioate aldolase